MVLPFNSSKVTHLPRCWSNIKPKSEAIHSYDILNMLYAYRTTTWAQMLGEKSCCQANIVVS